MNLITILYGSETGNAEGLAEIAAQRLKEAGFEATAKDMADVKAADLAAMGYVLIITSTWGDGEPPSNAWDLHGELAGKPSLNLRGLHYSVLSLGDSSYPQFCQCGIDFDMFLAELGAVRFHPRVDCDLDYDEPFKRWMGGVLDACRSAESLTPA